MLGLPESVGFAVYYLLQALEYFECMCKSVWKRICGILSQAEHERSEEHLNSARGADLE
jgi:hypothetical protein